MSASIRVKSPAGERSRVVLAHGGGGRLAQDLVDRLFVDELDALRSPGRYDGATIDVPGRRLAVATDSFVVNPLFFPGGDIGSLAVNGTVNDLVMCGARPLYLSVGFILEEGLELEALVRIASSIRAAAEEADVRIATGDTKVVNRGKGDGLYISTTGIGVIEHEVAIEPESVRAGDAILINGDIGRHGIAIMSSREGLGYHQSISSDSAPLVRPVLRLLSEGIAVHCLRDLTRGGLAGRLNEVAQAAAVRIELAEEAVPVSPEVRAACEFLGLNAYHISNEGRFVAFVAPEDASRALELLREERPDLEASRIGVVGEQTDGLVTVKPAAGSARIIELLSGEHLPRNG